MKYLALLTGIAIILYYRMLKSKQDDTMKDNEQNGTGNEPRTEPVPITDVNSPVIPDSYTAPTQPPAPFVYDTYVSLPDLADGLQSMTLLPIVTDDTGTYRLIRAQGPLLPSGAYDIALWAKDGVDQTQWVFMRLISGAFQQIPA